MNIFTYIRSHAVLSGGIAFVAVLVTIIAGRVASRNNTTDSTNSNFKKVSVVDVSNFRDDTSRVLADGIVESVSQVELRSQIPATLAMVNVAVGDSVYAGQTIAVLQNADIRAQLDQARAGLKLAQGQYTGSGISLDSSRKGALETLRSAYITADEIVNLELGQFLYVTTGSNSRLSSFVEDETTDREMRTLYIRAKDSFSGWKNALSKLTENSSDAEIQNAFTLSQTNLNTVSALLDIASEVIVDGMQNNPSPEIYTTLAGWQGTVSGGRNSINTALKNLTGAQATLSGAQVTYESPAEAQISAAQAVVKNLEAQLAKTIFVSPISGKIADLPVRVGELAQPGQLIATVIGEGDLQVKAYASGEDFAKIKKDAKALIQNRYQGIVVNVAPSVSAINKKVEVKVSVDRANKADLVVGQNVSVSIEGATATSTALGNYLLPIQNVKIVPGDAFVFTLDENSKVVKHSVLIGKIQGDFVEITSGITPDMAIVTPVYELEEGEQVEVQ